MGMLAAKMGDKVVGTDIHIIMIPLPPPPKPVPIPHPFSGTIMQGCSTNVKIGGAAAATVGSVAKNLPPHIPQGGPFAKPPMNESTIIMGSLTVMINGKPAARTGDTCLDCADPVPTPTGKVVVAAGTVFIG